MTTTEVFFRSDMKVVFRDGMGGDESVIEAMLVSTEDDEIVQAMLEKKTTYGRINFLMANRHGTPFEHNAMKFYAEVPIFVFREWHRHRIGKSYNEMSGRYRQLPPVYYVPDPERNLVQTGKPGHYEFLPGDSETYEWLVSDMKWEARENYARYERRLKRGIAKEVARMGLGINIYSAQYVTCNARSLMAFLSLRTKAEPFWQEHAINTKCDHQTGYVKNPGGSMFPSFPMREIEMAAEQMENVFAERFPMTYTAFCENGRVSP